MQNFIFKKKSLKELFLLLTEEDVKLIVMKLLNVEVEKTKHWRVSTTEDSYQVCVSDIENDADLSPTNSTVMVLTDQLDLYQQSYNFKKPKLRVGNLFSTYYFMQELLTQKVERAEA